MVVAGSGTRLTGTRIFTAFHSERPSIAAVSIANHRGLGNKYGTSDGNNRETDSQTIGHASEGMQPPGATDPSPRRYYSL